MMSTLHIGTSGWNYGHWRGPFYPDDLPPRRWLPFYAERFSSVEVNYSFYRLPARSTLEQWREAVPDDFVFAVKANRYITHMKKLKDAREPLQAFYERVEALGAKLGPILFQLPPNWSFNRDRLARFLSLLAPAHRHAFELRDERWINKEALELLRAHEAALCIYDFRGRTAPKTLTADWAYVRLHGPQETPYWGAYDRQTLASWAERIGAWRAQGRDVYGYFDNDAAGQAPVDARTLAALCADRERPTA